MINVRERQIKPEVMDQPGLEPAQHVDALRGLGRINLLSLTTSAIWKPVYALATENRNGPIRLLDIASGGGDTPLRLWERARRAGVPIEIHGCDMNATAVAFANSQAAKREAPVHFFVHDVVRDGVPDGYDVVTNSLFLHHLTDTELVNLLASKARAARKLIVATDVIRSALGLGLAYFGCYTLSRSEVVHIDGPISVGAAFTIREFRDFANAAGLRGYSIRWQWPFRFLFTWRKP